jgi:hypothetical protein
MTCEVFGPLAICSDCLMFAANGEIGDGEALPSELLDNPDANAGWQLGCGWNDDDDEGSFSWHPCDWCRRPLGGDRYPAHVFRDVPVPEPEPCGSMCRFCSLRCERKAGHYPATVHEAEGETWEDPGRAPLPLATYKGTLRGFQVAS